MFPVEQRAASALLLNLGRAETTSLDLLTREFHFLFFYGTGLLSARKEIMPRYHVLKISVL